MGSANTGTAIAPLSTIGTRYGNSVSSVSMPPKPTRHCRESRRKADTEFQYRPRIVDTDIDCGPRVCGPRFRDSYYLPEKIFSNYFPVTVSRFRFLRINFRNITRYLLHLCELCDITRLGPLSLSNYFLLPLPDFEFFRINWVMFSWQVVLPDLLLTYSGKTELSTTTAAPKFWPIPRRLW